jgi:transcriptional regulator with XRE-family HTH domain
VTPEGLKEFGNHVREARVRKGWTLEALAGAALNNPDRKGYVSQIENGKRPLSALTIGNLARVLNLPADVTRPLLFAPAPEDEVTREDRLAETLIHRNEADTSQPQAEALVIALAYEFAGGKFLDLSTAYTGLRKALEAAAEMRAELARLHNMDARLAAVLQRVEDLNNQGLRDAAGEELDAAIKAKEAELETLHDTALKQDRLRNRPESAAQRLIKRLRDSAPPEGLFRATKRLVIETRERGEQQGDPFDLTVALNLAKANLDRVNKGLKFAALTDLGNCHLALGELQASGGHLTRAFKTFAEALRLISRQRDPHSWAGAQTNIGNVLKTLGERTENTANLEQAIAACRTAVDVFSLKTSPMEWAASQNNLGNALQALGERTADLTILSQAVAAVSAALTVWTREDNPLDWAKAQNNLGIAQRTLAVRTADLALLERAINAHSAALAVRTPETTLMDWAASHNNLGVALQALGESTTDPAHLEQAVAAHRVALTVYTLEMTPMDWAGSQNNLGLALRWLGALKRDHVMLENAEQAFVCSLTQGDRDSAPFFWAKTQWNLADLALARHKVTPESAYLATARYHLDLAREVFAQKGNEHQLAECDRLQALINAG